MQTVNQHNLSSAELEDRLLRAIEACEAAQRSEASAAQRLLQASRRSRVLAGFALALVSGALALSALKPVGAQAGYGPTLASLNARLIAVETKTQFQNADSNSKTTIFSGCNMYIQSGSGSTGDSGSLTGLGNLTIGYNSGVNPSFQTGSHNLIIGDQNRYTSYGGMVVGSLNAVNAPYSVVVGGYSNSANATGTLVAGGINNTASANGACVTGGDNNVADNVCSSVTGGFSNIASGLDSSVCGGGHCSATGNTASILGGYYVTISSAFGHNP